MGLQVSPYPERFWAEVHKLPLSPESSATFSPSRGRYCLDDRCLALGDTAALSVSDYAFDYASQDFALRRPVPCPPGTYCAPGTALGDASEGSAGRDLNLTLPQTCAEAMYCPEGSTSPAGMGLVPPGFYAPFGARLPCPPGTFCAFAGQWDPFPCPPGTFNSMVAQLACTPCPVGYICPGFGRIDPAICPPGFACTTRALAAPNVLCPAGFYCSNGTKTSDPFRNDTTLRPYPCKPGTYCTAGTGYDKVRASTPGYAQNCTAGFYCETASPSPVGTGLCPPGFVCPPGTAVPVPTPKGQFAQQEGTLKPSNCFPGFYAPTIQTVVCYPCPPGTNCENDDQAVAQLCPPGLYLSIQASEGVTCVGCPQGTWSKQWELRDETQCVLCAPGIVCPLDGMRYPCATSDFPRPYTPTLAGETWFNCGAPPLYYGRLGSLRRGNGTYEAFQEEQPLLGTNKRNYPKNFWRTMPDGSTSTTQTVAWYVGYDIDLDPKDTLYTADASVGATDADVLAILAKNRNASQCYTNTQPAGSVVYQRLKDYHGPLYELIANQKHQGYGNDTYCERLPPMTSTTTTTTNGAAADAAAGRRITVFGRMPDPSPSSICPTPAAHAPLSTRPTEPPPRPRQTATTTSARARSRSTAARPMT